jgi:hypothetical protein
MSSVSVPCRASVRGGMGSSKAMPRILYIEYYA